MCQPQGLTYTTRLSHVVVGPTSSLRVHGFAYSVWHPVLSLLTAIVKTSVLRSPHDHGRFIPSDIALCSYYKKDAYSRGDGYRVGSW
jgi:hypothetical protein